MLTPALMLAGLMPGNGELWGNPQPDEGKDRRSCTFLFRVDGTPRGKVPDVVTFDATILFPDGRRPAPGKEIRIAIDYLQMGSHSGPVWTVNEG